MVVIELKRDDTGSQVHWQAIKYASYFHQATADDIVRMLAEHENISEDQAAERLTAHIDEDDLESLNRDQRIVLVSHRFAPEVTSAALWLNERMATGTLVTCVRLTPYHDLKSGALFLESSTLLPVAGTEELVIGIGWERRPPGRAVKRNDQVTSFFKGVAAAAVDALPSELKPQRKSRWAGVGPIIRACDTSCYFIGQHGQRHSK